MEARACVDKFDTVYVCGDRCSALDRTYATGSELSRVPTCHVVAEQVLRAIRTE